ncbi:YciI family protein [Pendulispora albinea]|uniref:YciI family protein n=1 Tax=Pendulispora albinea TaxID=2741071 RepID=A0ABZ2LZE0_9BACT
MRVISLVKSAETNKRPPPALMEAMAVLAEEATRTGAMIESVGLLPTSQATRMRLSSGELIITDGPFTEAKEMVGGYAIFEVASMEEALEWSKRFMDLHKEHWPEWEGETEIRPMFAPQDPAAPCRVEIPETK